MRVLVTGAAGTIGRVVTLGLCDRDHEVVGLDLVPEPEGFTGNWHTVDCADPDAVDGRLRGRAPRRRRPPRRATRTRRRCRPSLTSHVVTTAALLDAMVAHRVSRIVYASLQPRRRPHPAPRPGPDAVLPRDALPRPDTFYGVSKVAAEALLSLYADRLRHRRRRLPDRVLPRRARPPAAPCRPGSRTTTACGWSRRRSTAPSPGFAVLYGISANTRAWWDLEPGRQLGYEPLDDAEAFADRIPERPEDEAEAAYVGGPFALEEIQRPALGD